MYEKNKIGYVYTEERPWGGFKSLAYDVVTSIGLWQIPKNYSSGRIKNNFQTKLVKPVRGNTKIETKEGDMQMEEWLNYIIPSSIDHEIRAFDDAQVLEMVYGPTVGIDIGDENRYAYRTSLSENQKSTVKILTVNPGENPSVQYHFNRDEFWYILDGPVKIRKGDNTYTMKPGDSIDLYRGEVHTAIGMDNSARILQISKGYFSEHDIVRLDDNYKREKTPIEVLREKHNHLTVAVSGYFDPLHPGHLSHLYEARALGDELWVIVNNDQQTGRKKQEQGFGSEFIPLEARLQIVESLDMVDGVIPSIDTDRSVNETLRKLNPNIFAKGGDRNVDNIPERDVCMENGIKIIDGIGAEKKYSSSELLKKICG